MNKHVLRLSYHQLEWGSKRNQMFLSLGKKKNPLLWETFTLLVFMFYSSAMKISITLY